MYRPNVFGCWFASRIAGVYLFLLTVIFSLIFVIFMSIMIFISRSDISKWYIVNEARS